MVHRRLVRQGRLSASVAAERALAGSGKPPRRRVSPPGPGQIDQWCLRTLNIGRLYRYRSRPWPRRHEDSRARDPSQRSRPRPARRESAGRGLRPSGCGRNSRHKGTERASYSRLGQFSHPHPTGSLQTVLLDSRISSDNQSTMTKKTQKTVHYYKVPRNKRTSSWQGIQTQQPRGVVAQHQVDLIVGEPCITKRRDVGPQAVDM